LFSKQDDENSPVLITCAKWSQAENISTEKHKAITCHRAGLVGIQDFRNRYLLPGDKKGALARTWNPVRLLVLEEVSMISPQLYNMLLYRGFHGRRERWQVQECHYDKLSGAFGRVPIVVQLGDFLQLKPTGSSVSLITDPKELEKTRENYPAEWQMGMKLFCNIPLCFELQASNRFVDEKMRDLMNYIRTPTKKMAKVLENVWESIRLLPDDDRLKQSRFQEGHMIAIYWETVARWMMMRAKRDATALKTPLFLIQSADESVPPMPVSVAKKLMNKANPKDTGRMHGMFASHLGMRVRLLEALDLSRGLVKDAEGTIVQIAYHPAEKENVEAAIASGAETIYLRYLPLGIWVRMDKYDQCPMTDRLSGGDAGLSTSQGQQLVFVEPRTSDTFLFATGYKVKRTGFPLSHGLVITCTACQGRTMRAGVLIDCGRHESGTTKKEDEDWWLELYVMLSRATRLSDLLLMRAPPFSFWARGPPADLSKRLEAFAKRTQTCRANAAKLARDLGFEQFFH
jgi:hypothetical protein